MRVLKFFLTSLFIFLVLIGAAALITREVLLGLGVNEVKASMSELQAISRNATEYVRQCRQKGTPAGDNIITSLQLRFTSATQYQTEVICSQFPLDPIIVRSKELPLFVHKRPGSTGMMWGEELSGVGLEVFGRKRDVIVNNRVITTAQAGKNTFGTFPPSTCSGYGNMCCQAETAEGVGESFAGVTDCPRTCYSACISRPVILSFATDPFPEDQTRTIRIKTGESVTFSYVVSYDAKGSITATLEYGDGAKEEITELSSTASHVYECTKGSCTFTAQLSAKGQNGSTAAQTPLSQMKIIVD
jgi:hypothetical protein